MGLDKVKYQKRSDMIMYLDLWGNCLRGNNLQCTSYDKFVLQKHEEGVQSMGFLKQL